MDDIVLTRLDTGAKVFLPPDIRWVDEYEWHAIAQATPERTLSGGQIIQQGIKKSGRPITLSADNGRAPIARLDGRARAKIAIRAL